jgi:hypothetical protein
LCISVLKLTYRCLNHSFNIPLQPVNSRRNLPNPAINGLSCMLFPFFPRSPHLFASPPSSKPSPPSPEEDLLLCPFRCTGSSRGVEGLEFCMLGFMGLEVPPRIADTEECAHLACFRMADVTVIHSVVIRATGSTATDTGVVLEPNMSPLVCTASTLSRLVLWIEERSEPRMDGAGESVFCPIACGFTAGASLLILPSILGATLKPR